MHKILQSSCTPSPMLSYTWLDQTLSYQPLLADDFRLISKPTRENIEVLPPLVATLGLSLVLSCSTWWYIIFRARRSVGRTLEEAGSRGWRRGGWGWLRWSADIDDRSDRAHRFARRFQSNGLLKIERLQRFSGKGGSGTTSTVSDEANWSKISRRKLDRETVAEK